MLQSPPCYPEQQRTSQSSEGECENCWMGFIYKSLLIEKNTSLLHTEETCGSTRKPLQNGAPCHQLTAVLMKIWKRCVDGWGSPVMGDEESWYSPRTPGKARGWQVWGVAGKYMAWEKWARGWRQRQRGTEEQTVTISYCGIIKKSVCWTKTQKILFFRFSCVIKGYSV